MANFCKNCGSKINPGAKFCDNCGQPVSPTTDINDRRNVGNTGSSAFPNVSDSPIYTNNMRRIQPNPGRRPNNKKPFDIVLIGIFVAELLIVLFWHPGLLLSGNKTPKEEEKKIVTQKDVPVVVDSMRSNTLKLEKTCVSFGDTETGNAVLTPDLFDISESGDTQIYNLAFTEIPKEPFTLEMEVPQPAEGEAYTCQLGIPVKDNKGKEYFETIPVKTQWENGKVKASVSLDGVDDYLSNISYDAGGEMTAICINRMEELAKDITLANTLSTGLARAGKLGAAVIFYFSKEQTISSPNGRFLLHIPDKYFDETNTEKDKVYMEDAENYSADMEEIYNYYATNYDVKKRTYWPMDVYFDQLSDSVALFDPLGITIGGRFGYDGIDHGFMKINVEYLKTGYKRTKNTELVGKNGNKVKIKNLNLNVTKLYGAFAHEMFHFVQRCYVDSGGTQRWFDESSAAYFDSLFTGKRNDFQLEENYKAEWQDQFSVKTNDSTTWGRKYGRMPVFCYMMKRNKDSLKRAYEFLRDTGGYTDWKNVFEYAMGTTMAPFVRAYFQALVTKGTLYSKYNTPWEIYKCPISRDDNQQKIDMAAWNELRYTEIIKDIEPTDEEQKNSELTGKYTIPAYAARFVILDTSELPDEDVTLKVSLKTPSVDGTLYKIEGDSYDKVTYNEIPSEKETRMAVKKGDKLLLMLVNEKDSDCYGRVTYSLENINITSFIGHWSEEDKDVPLQIIITDYFVRRYYANYDDLNTVRAFDTGEREIISYEVNGNELSIIVHLQKQQDWVRSKCRFRLKDKDHLEVFWGYDADNVTPSYTMIRVPSK